MIRFAMLARVLLMTALASPGLLFLRSTAMVAPTTPPSTVPAAPHSNPKFLPLGASSCAASGCHGHPDAPSLTSPPDSSSWRSSYTHWRAADPHTRAFAALHTDLARDMVTALRKGDPTWKAAYEDSRCLACHTNPSLAREDTPKPLLHLREEGVSCEACHGNASEWLQPHLTWTSASNRDREHAKFGFAPLFDLGERAHACAGCHVGAPAKDGVPTRDMNHDMIAAGHPRLNFDFAEYQRQLPPHWHERDSHRTAIQDTPGVDSRAWIVGKLATAEAACELLADRATRASTDSRTPWPEFSESNCYACHHDLQPKSWRQETPGFHGQRVPGTKPWQSHWPFKNQPSAPVPALAWNGASAFDTLARLLKTPRRTPEHLQQTANAATALAGTFHAARTSLRGLSPAEFQAKLRDLVKGPHLNERDRWNWDETGQAYMALLALHRDAQRSRGKRGDAVDASLSQDVRELGEALRFKSGNSPADYSPAQVRDRIEKAQQSLTAEPAHGSR